MTQLTNDNITAHDALGTHWAQAPSRLAPLSFFLSPLATDSAQYTDSGMFSVLPLIFSGKL